MIPFGPDSDGTAVARGLRLGMVLARMLASEPSDSMAQSKPFVAACKLEALKTPLSE